jgi:hypothetical protein
MSRTVKQAYRKSRRFDKSCRNHGGCPYCKNNRLHNYRKKDEESLHGLRTLYDR